MNSGSRNILASITFLLAAGIGPFQATAAPDPQTNAAGDTTADGTQPAADLSDRPLEDFRSALLALAFEVATAIPVAPHLKDRSRAQEAVVTACLELDQPRRALECSAKIENWRRGVGFADVAFYLAGKGDSAAAQRELERAREVAASEDSGITQAWQRDRILAKVAATRALLGLTDATDPSTADLAPSEAGALEAVQAMLAPAEAFETQMQALDSALATGDFDQVQNAQRACARIFARNYADKDRRTLVEEKMKAAWGTLPVTVRIDLLLELSDIALEHADPGKALALVNEARGILDGHTWAPEEGIPLAARVATLRDRTGDREAARREADAALALFDAEREAIVDIYRAGALRPLAEAYQALGDPAAALAVYTTAVREGARNPNARPRAEDLSATCASMALTGVEPDAALRELIEHVRAGLGTPW